ncbi:hypothetical protein ACFSTA_01230 [Ornithinibacillus salinisoli]|uniref:Uncharacterized protein n=1 Tax=Ornithinibacillus salinisoli TaxID=1848459 RepID=A0ABW4VWL8_9BACI
MKRFSFLGIISILIIFLVLTSSNLYEDTKRYKMEIGHRYEQLVRETRSSVRQMLKVNLEEALESEYGTKLIENLNSQIRSKEIEFLRLRNDISKIGRLLRKVYEIQQSGLEQGEVSKEEINVYRNNLVKLNFILMDFDHDIRDWYDTFTKKDPEILTKMEKRLNED